MKSITLISMASLASASILWDGRFNGVSLADISKWDFSNPVGPYQWYIHGDGPITEYLDLSPSNKNTADTGSSTGLKVTIDNTAYWHGQNMRRTELIPQTTAPINKGKVFYHFSIMRKGVNPPSTDREHQICFFESHFTELKSGSLGSAGSSDTKLKWFVGGQSQWETEWEAGVWHNVAYAIDFDAGTVGFYHSVGGANLVKVGDKPVAASTSSNGADWHLGVLELPRNGVADSNEDFFFSGVYVEDGNITLSVSGPGGGSQPPTTTLTTAVKPTTTKPAVPGTTTKPTTTKTTTSKVVTSTAKPTGGAEHYAQCGGSGWTGATTCAAPFTCSAINPYYSQCL